MSGVLKWDPFVDLVFVLEGEGKAWMDDFSLMEVKGDAREADRKAP